MTDLALYRIGFYVFAAIIVYVVIDASRRLRKAREKTQYWFDRAMLAEGYRSVNVADFPSDLPIGTRANPVLTPHGDSARFSMLSEFVRRTVDV